MSHQDQDTSPATPRPQEANSTLTEAEANKITTLNQQTSPLLRLPGEIRNQIYTYIFTAQFIAIGHRQTPHAFPNPLVSTVISHSTNPQRKWPFYPKSPLSQGQPFSRLLAITSTCRQIRYEAGILPFRMNTFMLNAMECLSGLQRRIPRVQREAVKVLRIGRSMRYCVDLNGLFVCVRRMGWRRGGRMCRF
ncbi:hypothetical protein NX059_003742 [Plenodomus lindquistii]|nr:hypothetical protein NX059_003742 [Plenodomus lindquistii]